MKFFSNCTIGKVDSYVAKDGSKGANVLIFNLGDNGLDTLEIPTKDSQIIDICKSNINKNAKVFIDVSSNKFGTRISLLSVEFGK